MQELLGFYAADRSADLHFIRSALLEFYGPEPAGLRGSIDEQITGSLLSARTYDAVSLRAFHAIGVYCRGDFPALGAAPEEDIFRCIAQVNFPEKKARWLKLLWKNNPSGFSFAACLSVEDALLRLEQNEGVGRKVSAAALNFSDLERRAFVVDTHIIRVLMRFGFVSRKADTRGTYAAVMSAAEAMDAHDLYELHWHLKYLGQRICTAGKVQCGSCPLAPLCLKRTAAKM